MKQSHRVTFSNLTSEEEDILFRTLLRGRKRLEELYELSKSTPPIAETDPVEVMLAKSDLFRAGEDLKLLDSLELKHIKETVYK